MSAHIRPSRRLRLVLGAYALACGSAAVAMATHDRFHGTPWTAALCLLAGAAAAWAAWRNATAHVIDVSGLGELRLTVQQGMAAPAREPGSLVRLLPGSTVWPGMMVLLLAEEGGTTHRVLVWPDSLAPDALRMLAVAIRSIAGRDSRLLGKIK